MSQGRGFGIACGLAALVGSCAWFGAPYLLQIQGPEGTSGASRTLSPTIYPAGSNMLWPRCNEVPLLCSTWQEFGRGNASSELQHIYCLATACVARPQS